MFFWVQVFKNGVFQSSIPCCKVMVYRLVTRKSFESEMFDRASRKLGLERAVLGTRDFDGGDDGEGGSSEEAATGAGPGMGGTDLSQSEMEKLLRQGAYALLEDDDEVSRAFCEGDIDSILEERSRVRKIEAGATAEWLKNKGKATQSRVAKSTFTISEATGHADVAVDDPNFWAKVYRISLYGCGW